MKTKRIFVYGSLMHGFYNYEKFLRGKTINEISGAHILGKLFHLPNKGYPAAISGEDIISGEVIDVIDDGKILEDINQMEGFLSLGNCDNEYNLEMREVIFSDESRELIPVYIYNSTEKKIIDNDLGVYIPNGSWRLYMARTK